MQVPPDLHAHPVADWDLTNSAHCFTDFSSFPAQPHEESLLLAPPLVVQSLYGHALAIASLIWSMVMEPQPQLVPHLQFCPDDAQEQSAHLSHKRLVMLGIAVVAMVRDWVEGCEGEDV